MTEHYRAAVIGGGIVGCSVLYGLVERGWADSILLERRELTSGSTWHAAGNATYFGPYPAMTRLAVESIATYLAAEAVTGQSVGFRQTGSLRLATTPAERSAYEAMIQTYEDLGIPFSVVTAAEAAGEHPLINTKGVLGAARTPTDGHVDSSGATLALAKAARLSGGTISTRDPVRALERGPAGWRIISEKDDIIAEHIVLAASFWTRELASSIGLQLPLYAVQHHEIITGEVEELTGQPAELPIIRDPSASANIRQEGSGLLCGVYDQHPEFWGVDGIPPGFGEELLPPDLDRLMPELERVIHRLPAFGRAGVKRVNNGPICYTPDGCPLLGPASSIEGVWLACGFTIGIGTGGGAGRLLAHWMATGEPPYDIPAVYPSRFPGQISQRATLEQIRATYARGYRMD